MRVALFALLAAGFAANIWAAAPSQSDPRKIYGSDPRIAWGSYPSGKYTLSVANSNPDKRTVPEPGWRDSKMGDYVLMRTSDPTNGSKRAYRHRIKNGMTYKGSTARAESAVHWGASTNLRPGVPYWAVYGFYLDADHPFNGSGDDLNIMELGHNVTSKNTLPSIGFFVRKNGTFDALLSHNKVLNGGDSTRVTNRPFSGRSVQKKVWHYIVVQFKLEWDVAKKPYFRVWHAVGSGSPVQLCNSSVANMYRETATYTPQKYGIYSWNITNWGTSSTRTTFTKGLHVFEDRSGTPALGVGPMLEYIRAI